MGKKEDRDYKVVSHTPEWITAPLRVDREGHTKPGYLCIHDLENGNGLCSSTTFDLSDTEHSCVVALRRWNISRPCYDKPRRCPGWAGGGWKSAKNNMCHSTDVQSGYLNHNYEGHWKWKTHKCPNCGVMVLPYVIRWTSMRTWWYSFRYARSSWFWLVRLETWWGKKRGRW